jgi:hypothetical protein
MRRLLLFLLPISLLADMDVQTRKLANGLHLVAIYNPGSKSESIFTFLPLGLASDGPGQTQWSHWRWHSLFPPYHPPLGASQCSRAALHSSNAAPI